MEIEVFQKKLADICAAAEENNKMITEAQVRSFFSELNFDGDQLEKVFQYLKAKGIYVEQDFSQSENENKVPLTEEEEHYLQEYLCELPEDVCATDTETLAVWALQNKENARNILTNRFLPVAARMAVEFNCEELYIADLIQEANLSLIMAIDEDCSGKNDLWFKGRIFAGLKNAIEEQTQRKFEDDYLVNKVQNLESAVKELTEDDEETKFSIEELAVFLDMDVDEIRNVLRLTGDDK